MDLLFTGTNVSQPGGSGPGPFGGCYAARRDRGSKDHKEKRCGSVAGYVDIPYISRREKPFGIAVRWSGG